MKKINSFLNKKITYKIKDLLIIFSLVYSYGYFFSKNIFGSMILLIIFLIVFYNITKKRFNEAKNESNN